MSDEKGKKLDLKRLGEGSYGRIYRVCSDEKKRVLKRLIKAAPLPGIGLIRELDILNYLRGHPYIIELCSITFKLKTRRCMSPIGNKHLADDDVHFYFEEADTSLRSFININTIKKGYFARMKRYMYQLLLALEYLHESGYFHRDIKPENVLIFDEDGDSRAVLADLGMAEPYCTGPNQNVDIFATWYRPPEVCVGDVFYGPPSDIWSLGLVFAEMITRRGLLNDVKEDSDSAVLSRYISRLPYLSITNKDYLSLISRGKKKVSISTIGTKPESYHDFFALTENQQKLFQNEAGSFKDFVDLIESMLNFDPQRRITATKALNHTFFAEFTNDITWCRKNYVPEKRKWEKIDIIPSFERREAMLLAKAIYEDRKYYSWYHPRIIFQGINLFDRYLKSIANKIKKNAIESDDRGKLFSRDETHRYFIYCLYIAYKYFFIDGNAYSLTNFWQTMDKNMEVEEKDILLFLTFERQFFKYLEYDIYQETCYESYCRNKSCDEKETDKLLNFYISLNSREQVNGDDICALFLNEAKTTKTK